MTKFKTVVNKAWVFVAAAALIAGSSSAMAFALDRNVPESASAHAAGITIDANAYNQIPAAETGITAEYSVTDLSKTVSDQKEYIREKLSMIDGITPEQIEEKYHEIISNMTPGEKDLSAEQAAAYAAGILKKAYGVDFQGYTAEASFSRSPVPNSDSWTVIFHAPKEDQNTKRYIASIDSVNGRMLDASFYNLNYREENNKDLDNPAWTNKALQEIAKFLPENVSITGSKVVLATPAGGVIVVCELSDGSAYAVRLTGENKEAAAYIFFPNGYDGSLDYHPATGKSVG
ncbi:hypothetical protein [Candidatus Formimonas warabiya]|uniref:PepSY domain-containing protein n=1 Tax=Formimonas warabiya TaxID=1761012 RepID=A0A3G1KWI6_FORW1|nr:hypothetical protein [Candidatus Formimonas warabiya]ATW26565.1 hypothetical protein DCMF_19020 [Candidatus Formimonas warabiya]